MYPTVRSHSVKNLKGMVARQWRRQRRMEKKNQTTEMNPSLIPPNPQIRIVGGKVVDLVRTRRIIISVTTNGSITQCGVIKSACVICETQGRQLWNIPEEVVYMYNGFYWCVQRNRQVAGNCCIQCHRLRKK